MHLGAYVFAALALGSILSVAIGWPWTILVARRHNPREVWKTDLFRETNMLLSSAWAALFAGAAALAWYGPLWLSLGYGGLLLVLGHFSPHVGAWYATRRLRGLGLADPE